MGEGWRPRRDGADGVADVAHSPAGEATEGCERQLEVQMGCLSPTWRLP